MTTPNAKYVITADDQTGAAWKSAIGQAEAASKKLTSMFVGFIGGAAITQGIFNIAKSSAAAALEVKELSGRMQVSIGEASVMADAFQRLGSSTDVLETGFREFRKTLSSSLNTGSAAADVFDELGLSVERLRQQRPQDQIISISEAFESIKDPIERARVAQDLFGKSGKDMIPVLGEGAEKMREYMDAAVELDARGVDALDRISKANNRFWNSLGRGIANVAGITLSAFMEDTRPELQQIESKIALLESRAKSIRLVAISSGQIRRAEEYEKEAAALREVAEAHRMRAAWDEAAEERTKFAAGAEERQAQAALAKSSANAIANANALVVQSEAELLLLLRDINEEYAKRDSESFDAAKYADELRARGDERRAMESDLEKSIEENDRMLRERIDSGIEYRMSQNKWATDEINQYQIQAQRNTQNIIARYLRHGFEDGARGALKAFGDMLLDMAAQAAAANIASYLFGGKKNSNGETDSGLVGSIIGGIGQWFGGARAGGGDVSHGKGYLVGEQGPELFFPRANGFIAPNHALNGITIQNNISVPPGSNVSRADLDAAMRRASDVTIARLRTMQKIGRTA